MSQLPHFLVRSVTRVSYQQQQVRTLSVTYHSCSVSGALLPSHCWLTHAGTREVLTLKQTITNSLISYRKFLPSSRGPVISATSNSGRDQPQVGVMLVAYDWARQGQSCYYPLSFLQRVHADSYSSTADLSVLPSITLRCFVETNEDTIMRFHCQVAQSFQFLER